MDSREFERHAALLPLIVIGAVASYLGRHGMHFNSHEFTNQGSTDLHQMAMEMLMFGSDVYPRQVTEADIARISDLGDQRRKTG